MPWRACVLALGPALAEARATSALMRSIKRPCEEIDAACRAVEGLVDAHPAWPVWVHLSARGALAHAANVADDPQAMLAAYKEVNRAALAAGSIEVVTAAQTNMV